MRKKKIPITGPSTRLKNNNNKKKRCEMCYRKSLNILLWLLMKAKKCKPDQVP
jgi:hypothetical protein